MPGTIQPIIITADLRRLATFYTALLGAEDTDRVPEEGATFFLGLRIGDSDLGLAADTGVEGDDASRMLPRVDVGDVDAHLARVAALGGRVKGPANNLPWGQRVGHIYDRDGNVVNLTQPV